jgi:hypothetical protein
VKLDGTWDETEHAIADAIAVLIENGEIELVGMDEHGRATYRKTNHGPEAGRMTTNGWTFNQEYRDYEQVEHLLPEFEQVLAELTAAGQYRYNDLFKGRLPGLAGTDSSNEDTAIYLLQSLERERRQQEWVAGLRAEGYTEPTGPGKYAVIVMYSGTRTFRGETQTFHDGRLFFENDKPSFVIPKGKRTNGYRLNGRDVLVRTTGEPA